MLSSGLDVYNGRRPRAELVTAVITAAQQSHKYLYCPWSLAPTAPILISLASPPPPPLPHDTFGCPPPLFMRLLNFPNYLFHKYNSKNHTHKTHYLKLNIAFYYSAMQCSLVWYSCGWFIPPTPNSMAVGSQAVRRSNYLVQHVFHRYQSASQTSWN